MDSIANEWKGKDTEQGAKESKELQNERGEKRRLGAGVSSGSYLFFLRQRRGFRSVKGCCIGVVVVVGVLDVGKVALGRREVEGDKNESRIWGP